MLAYEAKAAAQAWVSGQAPDFPGLFGSFLHGSITWLPDDSRLSATSDVDVMLVVDDARTPPKPGKLLYHGALLDVSVLPLEDIRTPEQTLGQYHLAGSFRAPGIISDPTGHLAALQLAVARDYAKRPWVARRRDQAVAKVRNAYRVNGADPFPDQVVAWLFPAGILTHVLLVAGLRNPTVRRRYVAVRELLEDYGSEGLYERLLELLGCATMSRGRAEHHLAAVTDAFDVAKEVISTPFFFASDISDVARPIAIDGSREMIARGDHREAVFWLVVTYSRCQQIFYHDAPPETYRHFDQGYRELLGDLGMTSSANLQRGWAEVEAALPRITAVSEAIIAANPEIEP